MVIIKLHDYYDCDEYGYCCFNGIGMGKNSADIVNAQIDAAVKAKEDIEVDINSGGGYVYDGFSIYNALIKAKQTVKVSTTNSGLACSIASVLFMAGDIRRCAFASLFMMHPPTIDLFWYGSMDAAGLKREAAALEAIESVLASIYMIATGLPENVINDMIKATTWLTPTECKMQGFSTETVGEKSVKANAIEDVMNQIRRTAPANIQAYTNKFFNTIQNKMAKKETAAKQATNETKGLVAKLKGALNKLFPEATDVAIVLEDGTTVYADGELAVGVDVYSDEEMLLPVEDGTYTLSDGSTFVTVDGSVDSMAEAAVEESAEDIAALEAANEVLTTENLSLKEENAELLNSLKIANNMIKKISNSASNYKPAKRETAFSNSDKDKDKGSTSAKFSLPKKA